MLMLIQIGPTAKVNVFFTCKPASMNVAAVGICKLKYRIQTVEGELITNPLTY